MSNPNCFICGYPLGNLSKCEACYDELAAERDKLRDELERVRTEIEKFKQLIISGDKD